MACQQWLMCGSVVNGNVSENGWTNNGVMSMVSMYVRKHNGAINVISNQNNDINENTQWRNGINKYQ